FGAPGPVADERNDALGPESQRPADRGPRIGKTCAPTSRAWLRARGGIGKAAGKRGRARVFHLAIGQAAGSVEIEQVRGNAEPTAQRSEPVELRCDGAGSGGAAQGTGGVVTESARLRAPSTRYGHR